MDNFHIIKSALALSLLQASWSYQGKQTIGFLFALLTIKNRSDKKKQIIINSAFNTNPYCAGCLLGVLQHYQEVPEEWFIALQHTFGSLGDEFFWRILRPILSSLAILLSLYGYLFAENIYLTGVYRIAPLFFLVPFILISQGVKLQWLVKAIKSGRSACISLANYLRKPLPKLYHGFAFIAGMIFTVVIVVLLFGFDHQVTTASKSIVLIGLILISIFSTGLILRTERSSTYLLIGGLLIFLIFKLL